jgi:hypothetical protein
MSMMMMMMMCAAATYIRGNTPKVVAFRCASANGIAETARSG